MPVQFDSRGSLVHPSPAPNGVDARCSCRARTSSAQDGRHLSRPRRTRRTRSRCRSRRSSRGSSARRSRPAASSASPSTRPTARTTSSRSPRAACGRRPTPARPGRRCSTTRGRTPSAAWSWTRRTRTSSGSAPARTTASGAWPTATASTRSTDGGKTWQNVGLKQSEHIGKILIDPRDSDTVYVAAQGPLWKEGGDRGLYKTTDGGKTWNKVLTIDDNTGVTDVVLDPRNPDVLVAASYQRRRHVWTIINGGPGSAIHRCTDGGKTWKKITSGLPAGDLGRIGLAIAPTDPDTVYAIVEAADGAGGIHRSTDGGVTWEKRNPFAAAGAVLLAPRRRSGEQGPALRDERLHPGVRRRRQDARARSASSWKHVDNHALWIDPKDPKYYLCGCDGGIYESFDRGANWHMKPNLPITQFYDVTCDESGPFYHVYGGTQDNFTLGGPARTRSVARHHEPGLVRRAGRRRLPLQGRSDRPEHRVRHAAVRRARAASTAAPGSACRSSRSRPRASRRCAGTGTARSSSRRTTRSGCTSRRTGCSAATTAATRGRPVSGDLTRQLDRNKLAVMGKVWGPDAIFKHGSTSIYGNCVALAESPKKEGLIYVGTDDGLIQVTEDGGKTWRKVEQFPGVPANTYVSKLVASQHDANTVYACFDNHKNGDFDPYVLKSTDAGKTWTSDRRRPAGARHRVLPRRGPRRPEPAVRRHRVRPVRHDSTAARSGTASRTGCRRSR